MIPPPFLLKPLREMNHFLRETPNILLISWRETPMNLSLFLRILLTLCVLETGRTGF